MAKVEDAVLQQIRDLFAKYRQEISASTYSKNSKGLRLAFARNFVEWLGNQYVPLGYDSSMQDTETYRNLSRAFLDQAYEELRSGDLGIL